MVRFRDKIRVKDSSGRFGGGGVSGGQALNFVIHIICHLSRDVAPW